MKVAIVALVVCGLNVASAEPSAPDVANLNSLSIDRTFRTAQAKLANCAKKWARQGPTTRQARVNIVVTIDARGVVKTATARGLDDTKIETCVVRAIKALRFPRSDVGLGATISHPLILRLPDSD